MLIDLSNRTIRVPRIRGRLKRKQSSSSYVHGALLIIIALAKLFLELETHSWFKVGDSQRYKFVGSIAGETRMPNWYFSAEREIETFRRTIFHCYTPSICVELPRRAAARKMNKAEHWKTIS